MLVRLPTAFAGVGAAAGAGAVLLSGAPDEVSAAVEALVSCGWLLSAALRLDEQVWQVQLLPKAAETAG